MSEVDALKLDEATDKFMSDHREAISDLIRKVGDEALAKLHCLQLWGSPKVHLKLRDLIRKVVRSKISQGEYCVGAWDSDDLFVVTIDQAQYSGGPSGFRIRVALCLAESRVQ